MHFDILIMGGGPAGVVTSKRLAKYGYRIALLSKDRRLPAFEGLSERAKSGLQFADCQHTLENLGHEVTRQAHWNGVEFAGNREWLVERGAFDAALIQDVQAANIAVYAGRVTSLQHNQNGWSVQMDGQTFSAAFLIDARGRAAPHGRNGLRRGPATIALGQCWELPSGTPPGTQVAAFPEGWAWFAKGPADRGILQLFVSSETYRLPPRSRLTPYYHALLGSIPEAHNWLAKARAFGQVQARYAHPQCNNQLFGDSYARVGDAAFAIDPLSGHGIYEAISGALALATTVNTILAKPQDAALATDFYREKITHDFERMSRIGRDFYRMEQRWPEHAFWRERRAWPDDEPAHLPSGGTALGIQSRPVSSEGFITLQNVIVTPDHPRGIWQVAGIALVPLLQHLRERTGESLADIVDSYALHHDKPPEQCQTALAWLISRGLLRVAPGRPG